jgi:RHS repeat-associated protein
MTQAVDSVSRTTNRAYDGLDRLTQESGPNGTVNYVYDNASRRTSMTVAGQPQVTYSYDVADRLTQIAQGAATAGFGYDNANRRTSLVLPNGISVQYGYDAASELTSLNYVLAGTSLGNLAYTYDLLGNRASIGGSMARTGLPPSVGSAIYNAANRLTQWGSGSLSYDASGNLVSDGTNSYTWDARNRLASMTGLSFQYDAFGRRISRTSGGATAKFLYDGVNRVQELSGTNVTANLLTGLGVDETLARTDSTGTASFLLDGLSSTVALANGTGVVQTQYVYDAFGGTSVSGAASGNASQYTGRENDGTGLYYYRARYYNATLQRFISEDPIGLGGGINSYAYALDNPLSYSDPFGLDVTITAYPGANGNPFGHVGVSINGSPAVGFNPAPGWDPFSIFGPVPGAVLPVQPGRPVDPNCANGACQVTIHTTPAQDQAMLNYINNRTNNPGYYDLAGRNCGQFGRDVLNAGGVKTPWTPFPRELLNNLTNPSPRPPPIDLGRCPTGVCGLQ